jgi:competence protein ComEC
MIFDRFILSIVNSKSKTLLAFCFSFLAGVGAWSMLEWRANPWMPAAAAAGCLALAIASSAKGGQGRDHRARFSAILVCCFLAGGARYGFAFPPAAEAALPTRQIALSGSIAAEPDVRIDGVRYIVRTEEFGRIAVSLGTYPQFSYGDRVALRCVLRRPAPFDDFRYDMYLAKFGVFAACQKPSMEKTGDGAGSPLLGAILGVKGRIAEQVNGLWPEPHASFMAGLLYGYRGGLGDVQESFNRTGVSHIVAVSGYNMTVIAAILMAMLAYARIRRQKAFWIVCAGMICFTVLAGASASVLRAAVMGMLALTAKQIGRLSRPLHLIIPAAALLVLHNPLILFWDAGFQLSFAATLGLLVVAPLLPPRIPEAAAQTLAATAATLPLLLYQFGRLSLVSPIVNVLILWCIPWIMLLGAAAVGASFVFPPLAMGIGFGAWAGLHYILLVVEWFSALPFAAADIRISWWAAALLYAGLWYAVRRRRERDFSIAD